MNIQGYVSAWRPSNTNYTMAQSKNNAERDDAFGMIMESKTETDDYFDSTYWNMQLKTLNNNTQEATEKFANMSFEDILNSGYGRNAIPTVNQIVSSRNVKDEEVYLTYFTDDRITCNYADGRKAWEIGINDEQQRQKVKEFFNTYAPDENWMNTEYYSGNDISMAVQKNFWLDMFND